LPNLPVSLPDLPVSLPDLPVALPDLPVSLPNLPVSLPDLPVSLPDLPVSLPDLPLTVPDLPIKVPDLPIKVPDLPIKVPDLPIKVPDLTNVGSSPCLPDLNNVLSGLPGLSQLSSVGDLLSTLPGLGNLLTALPQLGGLPGILTNLTSALKSTTGLDSIVQNVLSLLSNLLASISTATGLPYGNIVSSIPLLRPLLGGLTTNLPQLSTQCGQGASANIFSGLNLNGRGGLTELLNTVLDFLSGLLISIPKLLSGLPLNQILSGLPNLNGILPNTKCQCQSASPIQLPVTPSLPITGVPTSSVLDGNTCGRCGALIDIHNNEINGVKVNQRTKRPQILPSSTDDVNTPIIGSDGVTGS
jgi:hypothetical protein